MAANQRNYTVHSSRLYTNDKLHPTSNRGNDRWGFWWLTRGKTHIHTHSMRRLEKCVCVVLRSLALETESIKKEKERQNEWETPWGWENFRERNENGQWPVHGRRWWSLQHTSNETSEPFTHTNSFFPSSSTFGVISWLHRIDPKLTFA